MMNQPDKSMTPPAIEPPNENVVNRIVEIFDLKDFNGFLELAAEIEDPAELLQFINEPEDIELFSDSFDDPDFANFITDLISLYIDLGSFSAEETGAIENKPGQISGTKWEDRNGDGIQNSDERGLAGWTIYLDANQNGRLDEGETSAITDADGNYVFEGLNTTETYIVAEVPKESDAVTFPIARNISITQEDPEPTAYTGTPNDPLFAEQWHLQNTGQTGGISGADANVIPAWQKATGKDVTIGIVDDSLQSNHPDLADKYRSDLSYDFVENDADPSPDLDAEFSPNHGTAVAGVAAASTNNQTGVAGVAPDAELAGLRLLPEEDADVISVEEEGFVTDAKVAEALSYKNQEIDIYNNSWGDVSFEGIGEKTQAALQNGVRNGRDGLGNIFVFAAGNGRAYQDNINYNALGNSRYTIAVAAIDHRDNLTFYSTPGSAVLVSGYSGSTPHPGITTTDVTGANGYNPEGDYNDSFGGTSSAAPLVSGVVALMLDTNPNLTWRDVQHILVETAVQNDPSDPNWTVNNAGHDINYKYGFGAVDADAAVTMAQNWTNVEPEIVTTSDRIEVNTAIPDNNGEEITSTVGITEDVQIEWVEVVFDAEHTQRGDLEVTLVSPDGTESILAETHSDVNDNYNSWVFTSNRHWDESSLGDWTLEVTDNSTGETGTWNSWQLNVYGTDPKGTDIAGAQTVTANNGESIDNIDFGSQQISDRGIVNATDESDRFVLNRDRSYTIASFNPEADLLSLPDNISFEQLEIVRGKGENVDDTAIVFESETIAILNDTNPEEITQSVFI